MTLLNLPELCEQHRIDDSLFAKAYAELGAEKRAVLKKNIALLFSFWGQSSEERTLVRHMAEGYTVTCTVVSAPYTLVVCEANYQHPACFLAAVLPTLLAGTGLVIPCFVGNEIVAEPNPALLVASELAGLEDSIFVNHEHDALPVLKSLHSLGQGRLLVLGTKPLASESLLFALENNVPCRAMLHEPTFQMLEVANEVDVTFADSCASSTKKMNPASLSVNSWENQAGKASPLSCPITLAKNCQNLWIWPDLEPEWFKNKSLKLTERT